MKKHVLPLLNLQKQEPFEYNTEGHLDVHSVFYTIQGEGPLAGSPAVFVRLAGCNLRCPLCDTDYTSTRKMYSPEELLKQVIQESRHVRGIIRPIIVLTGGEPFRQNFSPFVQMAQLRGYKVQIETNGTLWLDDFLDIIPKPMIVCSPKTSTLHPKIIPHIDALKYILSYTSGYDARGIPRHPLGMGESPCQPWQGDWTSFQGEIYIQPLDEKDEEKNRENVQCAVACCMLHGYRLCLQIHKQLGME